MQKTRTGPDISCRRRFNAENWVLEKWTLGWASGNSPRITPCFCFTQRGLMGTAEFKNLIEQPVSRRAGAPAPLTESNQPVAE